MCSNHVRQHAELHAKLTAFQSFSGSTPCQPFGKGHNNLSSRFANHAAQHALLHAAQAQLFQTEGVKAQTADETLTARKSMGLKTL